MAVIVDDSAGAHGRKAEGMGPVDYVYAATLLAPVWPDLGPGGERRAMSGDHKPRRGLGSLA